MTFLGLGAISLSEHFELFSITLSLLFAFQEYSKLSISGLRLVLGEGFCPSAEVLSFRPSASWFSHRP